MADWRREKMENESRFKPIFTLDDGLSQRRQHLFATLWANAQQYPLSMIFQWDFFFVLARASKIDKNHIQVSVLVEAFCRAIHAKKKTEEQKK